MSIILLFLKNTVVSLKRQHSLQVWTACGCDGQHPGVKLQKYDGSVNLGFMSKGLKDACDNRTAQIAQFIISALWSQWSSTCPRNEGLPVAASWSTTQHTGRLSCFESHSVCAEAELKESGSSDIWTLKSV